MTHTTMSGRPVPARLLHWIARLSALGVVLLLGTMTLGEWGSGPAGVREWAYLALFPLGFSVAYLLGWRWPLAGGWAALASMALSLLVIGRVFDPQAYAVWAMLCAPGVLYILAGTKLRSTAR